MSKAVRTAHILEEKWRSKDVRLEEKADFSSLLLSDRVLAGLEKSGFKIPSPIQIESIPVGRFGRDLVVQAKSGTGKTLVFTVIALEALLDIKLPQVLILAPTREIATQICDVIKSVGCEIKGLKCHSFIGGTPVSQDAEKCLGCQIVVGTPGRLRQLIDEGNLPLHSVRMFILDEADELLERSFKADIDFIFMSLPKEKQVIATSATYPKELKDFIRLYFRDAFLARLNVSKPALLGIVHYIHQVEGSKMPHLAYQLKTSALEKILSDIQFTQCVVFCNLKTRVEPLCYDIRKWGFSTAFISSNKEQCDRLKAIDCLKKFRCKVLVSSDLTARGIDAEKVDLIINFENPYNLETYMHRCGRAGRYGSKGAVISFLTTDEIKTFEKIKNEGRFQTYTLPDPVPPNLINLRAKELDLLNDESSENEDSVDKSPQTNEGIQNGKDFSKTNNPPLSSKKMEDSAENSFLREETSGPTESNGKVVEDKHVSINDAECDTENNHALKNLNSNGSEIIQECIINGHVLNNSTSISVESEKVCDDVSEKSNCVKCTEEAIKDESFDKTLPNGCFDNINHSYISNATKESELLHDVQLCKDKNDINTCNEIQEVLHNESILKDLNGVEVENPVGNCYLNASKKIKQNLQIINSDCENERSVSNDVIQKSAVTFVSNSNFNDNNLNSDITPVTENKSEASISLGTNNNVQLKHSDIKLKISKNLILNKIQLPIVRFLVDYKKKENERDRERDSSLEKINIKSAPKDILKSTKLIQSHQVKEVRENLSKFYQKIFDSYQTKFIDEKTHVELKFASNPQSFVTENGITYEKIVLRYNKKDDKPDDASSVSSGFSAYKLLEDFMFQGKKSGKDKDHKIVSNDISTTSSSSSDSSSDSSDAEHYRELLRNKVKQQNSSTAIHNAKWQSSNEQNQPDIKASCSFEKVSGNKSNFASYINDDDDGRHGARRKILFKNCQIQKNVARKLSDEFSSDSEDSNSEKFTGVPPAKNHIHHVKKTKVKSISKTMKSHKNVSPSKYSNISSQPYYHFPENYRSASNYIPPSPLTSQCNKSNFASYINDNDGRHDAGRKTFFENYQIQTNDARNLSDEFSSDSADSNSPKFTEMPPAKNPIPHVKKTKVESIPKTMKDHKNVSPSKYTSNSSQPYYHFPQNYRSASTYIPPTLVTSQNSYCSKHQCHVAGSSFCFNGVCSDWYEIFQKQWKYIQMFSTSGHQMPLYY